MKTTRTYRNKNRIRTYRNKNRTKLKATTPRQAAYNAGNRT